MVVFVAFSQQITEDIIRKYIEMDFKMDILIYAILLSIVMVQHIHGKSLSCYKKYEDNPYKDLIGTPCNPPDGKPMLYMVVNDTVKIVICKNCPPDTHYDAASCTCSPCTTNTNFQENIRDSCKDLRPGPTFSDNDNLKNEDKGTEIENSTLSPDKNETNGDFAQATEKETNKSSDGLNNKTQPEIVMEKPTFSDNDNLKNEDTGTEIEKIDSTTFAPTPATQSGNDESTFDNTTSTTSYPETTTKMPVQDSGLSGAGKAGIVIGAIVVFILFCVVMCCACRKKKSQSSYTSGRATYSV